MPAIFRSFAELERYAKAHHIGTAHRVTPKQKSRGGTTPAASKPFLKSLVSPGSSRTLPRKR